MEVRFLLDSNTAIDFLGGKLPPDASNFIDAVVDEVPNISVITKIEILSYKEDENEYQVLQIFVLIQRCLN